MCRFVRRSCVAFFGFLLAFHGSAYNFADFGEHFLCLAVFLFAYATVICWAQYGIECVTYLTDGMAERAKKWGRWGYIVAFCACTFVGAVVAPSEVWTLADFSIGSMTLINVFVLCLAATQVKRYTDRVFKAKKELSD